MKSNPFKYSDELENAVRGYYARNVSPSMNCDVFISAALVKLQSAINEKQVTEEEVIGKLLPERTEANV